MDTSETLIAWNIDSYTDVTHEWLKPLVEQLRPFIIFLSETKKSRDILSKYLSEFNNYDKLINENSPAHYHGVVMLVRSDIKYQELDVDLKTTSRHDTNGKATIGRVIAIETSEYIVVGTYSPNSGIFGLKNLDYRIKQWDPAIFTLLEEYRKKKEVIWMGDINVALDILDVSHPERVSSNAGFTPEERDSLSEFLKKGWIDIWRKQHPETREYSWVGYPKENNESNFGDNTTYGMRLDNFIISPGLEKKVISSFMLPKCLSSDHIPVGIKITK